MVVEIKSRLTTENYPSAFFALKSLEGASIQASRKAEFIRNNLSNVLSRLNWNVHNQYNIFPIVITDNHAGLGAPLFGVPIIDVDILIAYFEKNYFCLHADSETFKPLIKLILYKNEEEGYSNLQRYLLKPPQTNGIGSFTIRKKSTFPCISNPSYRIIFNYIAQDPESNLNYLKKIDYSFEIEYVTK